MIDALKREYFNENFEGYFLEIIEQLRPEQKTDVPLDLLYKQSRGGKMLNKNASFWQKMYLLYAVAGKRFTLLIEDEEAPLTLPDFQALEQSYRHKGSRQDAVDRLRSKGAFLLGSADLMAVLEYGNMICATNLYKLASDYRTFRSETTRKATKRRRVQADTKEIFRAFAHYEGNKLRIPTTYGITIEEWYAMCHYYWQIEDTGPSFYKEAFKYAYHCCLRNRQKALIGLKSKGYLDYRGKGKKRIFYFLTPKGRELATRIMARIGLGY